jgi:hypothetical protein
MKRHKFQVHTSRSDASAEEVKEAEELMRDLKAAKLNQHEEREARIA